jgi:hypothetical protein
VGLALALAGAHHPATTHSANVAPRVAIRTSVAHTTPATQAKPRLHRVAAPRDHRSRPLAKRSRKTIVHLIRGTAGTHASLPDTAVSEFATTSPTTTPLQTPSSGQATRTDSGIDPTRRSNTSACVPGELGC